MKIRTKLAILLLAIGLIPLMLLSVITYSVISNELTKKTVDQLTSIATSQQEKLYGLLQAKEEEATNLANEFDLQSAWATYNGSNGKQGTNTLYNVLTNTKINSPDIQNIDAISLDGNLITSTTTGEARSKLPAADYSIAPGQESAISIKVDSRDGVEKLYITNQIEINKQRAGYLNVVIRIDDVIAAIQDYTGLGNTGETIMAAKGSHNTATTLFPLRFNTDVALKPILNAHDLYDANMAYSRGTDYRGHAVLVTSLALGVSNWVIATKMDVSEALAPATQLRDILLVAVALSSVGILLLSIYFTRFFTRPILQVASVAQNIGKGSFASRVAFRRKDEIGALGTSINAMGQSLQGFVNNIERERNRLSIIINSTTETILAIDEQGIIILANEATSELTGQADGSIVGKHIRDIFSWKRDMQQFVIDYTLPGVRTYSSLEYVNVASETHYVKVLVSQVVDSEKQLQGPQAIITVHDETKSRELEDMKVDFVSMAAHELRTPLAATRGYLELVLFKEGTQVDRDIKDYLQQALKSTSELGSLINNLLGVTRIERGTLPFNPEKLDLATDIQQVVHNAGFGASEKKISLSYDGPAKDCFIIADKISLHEVINNLLNNAIKYTNAGGAVRVSLTQDGDNYLANFSDTGIGIPKQAMPNLFTKFYRVRGGLNSGSTGTGLGLFISKSIIERHGGMIRVSSEEGKGLDVYRYIAET